MTKSEILEWYCREINSTHPCMDSRDGTCANGDKCDGYKELSAKLDELQADTACAVTRSILGREIIKNRRQRDERINL